MMKTSGKQLFLLIAAAFVFKGKVDAQNKPSISSNYIKVYQNAMESGDGNLAIVALASLAAEEPKTNYRDTLAMLYYQNGQPATALYWINQRLLEKPNNMLGLKELRGDCLTAIGDVPTALTVWEDLSTVNPKNKMYLWQLANAQYSIRKQAEALTTIDKLESLPLNPSVDTLRIIAYNSIDNKERRYTNMPAALANMKGLIFYELKKTSEAKTAFAKANQLDSSYTLAHQNLAVLEQEGKPNTNNANPSLKAGNGKP